MPAVAVGPHDGTSGSSVSTLGSDHASNGRVRSGWNNRGKCLNLALPIYHVTEMRC